MNLTNEQIQQILDGAPDWQKCYCTETNQRFPYENYRNLSDLREILELRQEVGRLKVQQSEVAARAVESAVELYTHKWSKEDELNQVGIDILRRGIGYIYPEGLLEYAKQLREQSDE